MSVFSKVKSYFCHHGSGAYANNSENRNEWVKNVLLNLPAGSSVLDAGAGEQQYKKYCKHLNYVSQDFCQYKGKCEGNFSEGGLIDSKWNTSTIDIVSDISDIPVEKESFDYVLCTEVMEHLQEPIKAIHEFSRILRGGGQLIITAPVCSLSHQVPYYFYNGFSTFWYKKVFEDAGLVVEEMTPNGNFFEYLIQELNRVNYCKEKYCDNVNVPVDDEINRLTQKLRRISKVQKGSEELLCFGWHVVGRKL